MLLQLGPAVGGCGEVRQGLPLGVLGDNHGNQSKHTRCKLARLSTCIPAEMVLAMRTDPKVKCEEDEGEGMSV